MPVIEMFWALLPEFQIWKLSDILKKLSSINGTKLMIIFLLIVFSRYGQSLIGIH